MKIVFFWVSLLKIDIISAVQQVKVRAQTHNTKKPYIISFKCRYRLLGNFGLA